MDYLRITVRIIGGKKVGAGVDQATAGDTLQEQVHQGSPVGHTGLPDYTRVWNE